MGFSETVARRGIESPWESIIQVASAKYGIEVALIKSIISQESAWQADAVNPDDPSYGLMQLNYNFFKTANGDPILDPQENVNRGTAYLAEQTRKYGSRLEDIISSYNAGHPITGNQASYVQPVMQYLDWFRANDSGSGGGTTELDNTDIKLIAGIVVLLGLLWVLVRR
jgi:soluble lytic murein transglycosylase-like protein